MDRRWILIDTETTGFANPIYAVELGAQRMLGWKTDGEPFRKLLNQNHEIPAEASRVHGYTREILERDGEPPIEVYEAFREYVGDSPIVAYNTAYDLQRVLIPEWNRLRIEPIGSQGLCAMRLTQRLLDPVPAGNCKLQTLRQYYRLPERGAHTALGDVLTVADLFATVLRPIAEERGLISWDLLTEYACSEWYPSRIAFGKFKGRILAEAKENKEFRQWFEWLASSRNGANARMGAWYLAQLERIDGNSPLISPNEEASLGQHIVIYKNPELAYVQSLVERAQMRLAEVEAAFGVEQQKVAGLHAKLFAELRLHYEQRDRLRLIVQYRRSFIEKLLHSDESDAEGVREEFEKAEAARKQEYESTASRYAKKHELTPDEEEELKSLWKRLVKLFHPDTIFDDPEKRETYLKLTQAINHAKDIGDLATLRKIANDPYSFIREQGWASVELEDEREIKALRYLLEMLQIKIVEVLEATNSLKETPDYELYTLSHKDSSVLKRANERRQQQIETECTQLTTEAQDLAEQIEGLTGEKAFGPSVL